MSTNSTQLSNESSEEMDKKTEQLLNEFRSISGSMIETFDKLDAKFDKLDAKFDKLENSLNEMSANLKLALKYQNEAINKLNN